MKNKAFFLIYSLPVLMIAWLLLLDIRPAGNLSASLTPGSISPFIERPLPDSRVSTEDAFILTGDPVYFSVYRPETEYKDMEVEIVFDTQNQPVFEFGPQMDLFSGAADLRPAYHAAFEETEWQQKIPSRGRTLFTNTNSESIDDFLETTTDVSKVGVYKTDWTIPYKNSNYTPLNQLRNVPVNLRGSHKMQTYIKNESLDFEFLLTDMNRNLGEDPIMLNVYNTNKQLIESYAIADDGNVKQDQEMTVQTLSATIDDLPEGVYTLDLRTTSDVFVREIRTYQRYLTFVNNLYIGDTTGYKDQPESAQIVTNAYAFTLKTLHVEGLQTIRIGSVDQVIDQTHTNYSVIDTTGAIRSIDVPKGDMQFVGNGSFALSKDMFFEPNPVTLGPYTNIDNLDGVLAEYESPRMENGSYVAKHVFDLNDIPDINGSMRMVLSAPFIESFNGNVGIHEIRVHFIKPRLSIGEFIQEVIRRIPFGIGS